MHPFDVLYRGLNLTEPSQDTAGLVRTWALWMGVSLVIAWQLEVRFPHWPTWLDYATGLALLAAPFPAAFATFGAAQARACRIETSDVVELSLLGGPLRGLRQRRPPTGERPGDLHGVARRQPWRRRERNLDRPFALAMPLHSTEEESQITQWWMSADSDDLDATVRFHPSSPGRIDHLTGCVPFRLSVDLRALPAAARTVSGEPSGSAPGSTREEPIATHTPTAVGPGRWVGTGNTLGVRTATKDHQRRWWSR